MQIDEPMDTTIRESIINEPRSIAFGDSFTPVDPNGKRLRKQNIVGEAANIISDHTFSDIFTDDRFT